MTESAQNSRNMADPEKPDHHTPHSPTISSDSGTLSRVQSEGDLEKAETAADRTYLPITTSASNARTASRPNLAKTRTGASVTDGYSSYSLVDHPDDQDDGDDALAVRRTPTDAYEVRWDGKSDALSPRNMSFARKWLITSILSFSSFLV
jgi:hypothetical protein